MKQLTQKIAAIAIVMIGFAHTATAQVKVGDNPTSISASSVLELESTNKGLVLTRLTTAQMNAITATALNGMIIFNTDAGCVFQKRSGSWHSLCSINVDSLAKAVMQSPVKDSIAKLAAGAEPWYNTTTGTGATTNTQNIYQMGNVGIGTTTPTEKLHLAGNMRINNNFRTHTEIINLPATVNDIVNFATETNLNGSANYRISVTVPTSSYSQTKTYIISSQYAAGGGLWKTVTPLTSTNVYAGNSFDLEFYNNNSIDSFRLRNTSGGIVGTAYIFFEETGNVALNTYTSITGTDISGTTSSGTLNPYSGIVQEPWYNVATNTGATANTQDIYQMGKVGIGSSSPTAALHILRSTAATDNSDMLNIENNSTGNFPFAGINTRVNQANGGGYFNMLVKDSLKLQITHSGNSNQSYLRYGRNVNTNNYFQQVFDGTTGHVFIGNFGINPTNRLHVKDATNPVRFEGLQSGTATDSIVTADANGVLYKRSASAVAAEPWYNVATGTGATANTQDIYQMGNVGIGTSSFSSKMMVRTTSENSMPNFITAFDTRHFVVSGGTSGMAISSKTKNNFLSSATPNISWDTLTTQAAFYNFTDGGTGSSRMYVNGPSGNLGIGTTTPTNTLDVNGTTRVRTLAAGTGTDAIVTADATGVLRQVSQASIGNAATNFWRLTGNAGTSASTNFIGTTDAVNFNIRVNNNQALSVNNASRGIAIGDFTSATGTSSIAQGNSSVASGVQAVALGYESVASGQSSLAAGYQATASGITSIALGLGVKASGVYSVAIGGGSNSFGQHAGTFGQLDSASGTGNGAWAIGYGNRAFGDRSIALGASSSATGILSMAIGQDNIASASNSFAIGSSVNNATSNSIQFGITTSKWMMDGNTGNFGILTTTPTNSLDVNGTTRVRTLAAGTGTDAIVTADATGVLRQVSQASIGNAATNFWALTGNAGTVANTNFLGTTDNVDVRFRRNNVAAGSIGVANTSFGLNAGNTVASTGTNNTAIGTSALFSNTTGLRNTALGNGSLSNATTSQANTAIGNAALLSTTTGSFNTATGDLALAYNTTGTDNVAYGYNAIIGTQGSSTGSANTGIGTRTIQSLTSGNYNTALGYQALNSHTSGSNNTELGYAAGYFNTTGSQNIALGSLALYSNVAGSNAVAIGVNAMLYTNNTTTTYANTNTAVGFRSMEGSTTAANNTGIGNTALGYQSLVGITTGSNNVALGNNAMLTNTTGSVNTAVGNTSLFANTTGNANTAFGNQSLRFNTTGSNNTAIGDEALYSNTTGDYNTALGLQTLYSNTTGTLNTAAGYQSLKSNTTGNFNTGTGNASLINNTIGNNNSGHGYQALSSNTTGSNNTANGFAALNSNSTGNSNTASGYQSLYLNTTGTNNTALGTNSMLSNSIGGNNTSVGSSALNNNTTGASNTAMGTVSGFDNTTGINNSYYGYNTGLGITTGSNNTILGANVIGLSATLANNIIIADGAGNQRINAIANGNVGIGTSTPTNKLHVTATANPIRLEGLQTYSPATDAILAVDANGVVKQGGVPASGYSMGITSTDTFYASTYGNNIFSKDSIYLPAGFYSYNGNVHLRQLTTGAATQDKLCWAIFNKTTSAFVSNRSCDLAPNYPVGTDFWNSFNGYFEITSPAWVTLKGAYNYWSYNYGMVNNGQEGGSISFIRLR